MEGLLILIGIWLLDVVIKKVAANRKKQRQLPPTVSRREEIEDDQDEYEAEEAPRAPRSLQDLIRQFEDAQRQATQGNIEPPTPPVQRKHAEQLTLRDIAEVVIDVDFVNLEFLMDSFDVDENTAAEMLMDLQAHHIVGHDMGEGDCDVLVHDIEELDNLLNREQRTAQEQEDSRKNEIEAAQEETRRQELERQQKLNALEERAKSARESAAAFTGENYADSEGDNETAQTVRRPVVSTRDIADVRKGFIWAKVLDEPRFKRRWSAQYR